MTTFWMVLLNLVTVDNIKYNPQMAKFSLVQEQKMKRGYLGWMHLLLL